MTAGEKKVLDSLQKCKQENGPNYDEKELQTWDAAMRCPYCGKMNNVCTVDMTHKEGYVYFVGRKCNHCNREWLEQWMFMARSTCM